MTTSKPAAPGIYINELNAFPNSVVPVATAIPAFIGYTPKAEYEGKSYRNKPVKINSFAEFQAIFLLADPAPPADPAKQYQPEYYLVPQKSQPSAGEYMLVNGIYYSVLPDPGTIYYFYNSIRLFFQNGGGAAFIVSVGAYGPAVGKPIDNSAQLVVNPNIKLTDLQNGLALLKNEPEPTLYICPDATLLSLADNSALMQSMLLQASDMQTAVCIFDVIGGAQPDPILYTQDIDIFRNNVGDVGLSYGACYYPFIGTAIMSNSEIDFTNLFGGDIKQLEPLLNPSSAPNPTAANILKLIENPPKNSLTISQSHNALLIASKAYSLIINHILTMVNILPPSGAMAGVYTQNDNDNGVWQAPANMGIVGAVSLPIRLSDTQQSTLNVDPVSGKSINAIRFFNGVGILIWGARTLDGNSQDWRYISVRRTMIYLEQSIKLAMNAFIFEPNDANTWAAIKNTVDNFLINVWKQGGLQGAKPEDAFQVCIGLGSTMTGGDILDGYLRLTAKVATTHPAEFIVITVEQQQAKSS